MSSGSQTPVTQQTTQTKDPWSVAQPYLAGGMNSASALYNQNVGYTPYTGQTQASLHPYTTTATQDMANFMTPDAAQGGTAGNIASRALGLNMIQNQGLSPELRQLYQQAQGDQNPYLNDIIAASNRQIGDKVNSSFSGAGRYGSGQHTDVATRAMAEAANPILAQDYARRQQQMQGIAEGGLQRAGQWSQLMPTLDADRYAPAQSLMALGQYYQDRDQAQMNDAIKQYNAQQAYPWESLARYQAIVGGAGGLGGTQVTSSPIQQPTTMQKLFGGGLAGAGLGGSIFGAPGAAAGALGGGLLGLL